MSDRDQLERRLRMMLAGALTGAATIGLVQYILFPVLARKLTPGQVIWLREAFKTHTGWFLFATMALVAVLGAPVLMASMWAGHIGPWRHGSASR